MASTLPGTQESSSTTHDLSIKIEKTPETPTATKRPIMVTITPAREYAMASRSVVSAMREPIKMPSKAVANITIHFGSCISMPVAKPLKLAVMSNAANI